MNLKQLSLELGLSQTTVSRALNGYPEVAAETRARVLAAARAAQYAPSGRARSLATGRAMAIGHVLPVSSQHEMVNPVFGDFVAGAGEIYSAAGYEMVLTLVPDDGEAQFYRDLKARGSVDGLVLQSPRMADPRIDLLSELGLPFVVHGRASEIARPYAWLDLPNTRAFEVGTRHLIDLGHRRIALINGKEEMDFAHRRRRGFETALAEAGLVAEPRWMRSGEMTEALGHAAAREMLADLHPPSAFFTSSLVTALGVQRAIAEAGLVMGRDISVVTFDDDLSYLRNGTAAAPIFAAVQSSVRDAGRALAAMLLERIQRPEETPRHRMMEMRLVPGPSAGPAPDHQRARA